MLSKRVLISSLVILFLTVSFYPSVFAERQVFKPVLNIDKLEKNNLSVEEIPGTGNYRIYYRGADGEIHFVRFEPATKVGVIVKSTVEEPVGFQEISPSEGPPAYIYRYEIQSLRTSRQPVRTFVVGMKVPKGTKISPMNPKDWYSRQPRPSEHAPNWVRWSALPRSDREPSTYIQPGESLEGFALRCPGLPGILTAYIKGHITIHELREEADAPLGLEENSVQGKVIGPVPIPEVFRPVDFAAHLESLFAESVQLGWVNDEPEVQPLLETLKSVKTALDKNQIAQARSRISEFLTTLESVSKTEKVLTSEATSMLKINAQYLLNNVTAFPFRGSGVD